MSAQKLFFSLPRSVTAISRASKAAIEEDEELLEPLTSKENIIKETNIHSTSPLPVYHTYMTYIKYIRCFMAFFSCNKESQKSLFVVGESIE
jgi:hypothetical protein